MATELIALTECEEPWRMAKVQVEIRVAGAQLLAEFKVTSSPLLSNDTLPYERSAWGLWEHDVCELFVSQAQNQTDVATAPYYEFQVSPLGQHVNLKITEPRKTWQENLDVGLCVASQIHGSQVWQASICVELQKMGLTKELPIFGNAYSCLGPSQNRLYMALHYRNDQGNKPLTVVAKDVDFHRRELFRPLWFGHF
jgi:hypothetical protein